MEYLIAFASVAAVATLAYWEWNTAERRSCRQLEKALAPHVARKYETALSHIDIAKNAGAGFARISIAQWDPMVIVRVRDKLLADGYFLHPSRSYLMITWPKR